MAGKNSTFTQSWLACRLGPEKGTEMFQAQSKMDPEEWREKLVESLIAKNRTAKKELPKFEYDHCASCAEVAPKIPTYNLD